MQGDTNPSASVALHGGGTATLYTDRLELPSRRVALSDLVWAGLVVDTSIPVVPGGWPSPAAGLQLHDGTQLVIPVADPPDAWRLLEALYRQRPDLRQALPPQPGRAGDGPVPPPSYTPSGAAPGGPSAGYSSLHGGAPSGAFYGTPPSSEMVLAGIAHLSIFFAPLLLPLILWLVTQRSAPYASRQAKQAFFFHLGYLVIFAAVAVVWVVVIFGGILTTATNTSSGSFLVVPIIAVFALLGFVLLVVLAEYGYSIYGAMQAFQGRPFSYPFLGHL